MSKFKSFSDVIEGEPERLVAYAFQENPNIQTFNEFDDAFRKAFDTPLGSNAKIDAEDMIRLFESKPCKEKIKQNINAVEFEKLYGDGITVQREPISKTKVVTITFKKISIKPHTRGGIPIKPYTRGFKRWNQKEIYFLKTQKQKKISPKKIISNYNTRFKDSPRTESSIKTKLFRS